MKSCNEEPIVLESFSEQLTRGISQQEQDNLGSVHYGWIIVFS